MSTIRFKIDCAGENRPFLQYFRYCALGEDEEMLALFACAAVFERMMRHHHARTCSGCITDYPPIVSVDSETNRYSTRVAREHCDVCGRPLEAQADRGWCDADGSTTGLDPEEIAPPAFPTGERRLLGESLPADAKWADTVRLARAVFDAGQNAIVVKRIVRKFEAGLWPPVVKAGKETYAERHARLQHAVAEIRAGRLDNGPEGDA